MADQKNQAEWPQPKRDPAPPPAPEPAPGPGAPLGSAAASADPLVHQVLAERAIAVSNGDDDAVQAADSRLADLGVTVE